MSRPTFLAVADVVPELGQELLVCLGRPESPLPAGREAMVIEETVTDEALARLAGLDPARMAGGLVIATATGEWRARPRNVLRAQKILACLYTKYVHMPLVTTRVPDLFGLRPAQSPPEYLHWLNQYRNTPLHLRHCLVDKLARQRVGLPCLLLLPGPSLRLVADHLPELARRYLLVAISRTLPFLRERGLAPDVLLQLDTVPLQQHFHRPDDRFPRSALLSLSIAPVHAIAPRFRRVFFIDSFDVSILPNKARLRESWLSSLLPCLGAVEALAAPQALVIGADLRHDGASTYYNDAAGSPAATAPTWDKPLLTEPNGDLVFADAQGRQARTALQYFATAAEAERFAIDIGREQGTAFCNLSPSSILDPEVFAPLSLEQALDAPVIDKDAFVARIDAADKARETISLRALRAQYTRQLREARRERDVFVCLRLSDKPENAALHPCARYVEENLPWFRPTGRESRLRMAENLADAVLRANRFARNVAALHVAAAKGETPPVLTTAAEEPRAREGLGQWRPGWNWRFLGVRAPGNDTAAPSAGAIDLNTLCDWLGGQDVVIITPDCAREFAYVLELADNDNLLDLEAILAYRPLTAQ